MPLNADRDVLPEIPPGYPVELRALIALLASRWEPSALAALAPADGFSWDRFVFWVGRHRVGPLLHKHLDALHTLNPPAEVVERIHTFHRKNFRRVSEGIASLGRMSAILGPAGVPFLCMKGLMHSSWLFDDTSARFLKDVDVLVPADTLGRVDRLLRADGFLRTAPPVLPGHDHEDAAMPDEHHFTFVCGPGGIPLEVHRRLFRSGHLWPEDFHAMHARRREVSLGGGVSVSAPSEVDTLLHMLVHGAIHAWARLFWLCDVAEAFRAVPASQWTLVRERAEQLGYTRIVAQSARLARSLLCAPVPEPIAARLPQMSARSLLMQVPLAMISTEDHYAMDARARARQHVYRLALHGGLAYRADTLRYIAATKARGLYRRLFASGSARS